MGERPQLVERDLDLVAEHARPRRPRLGVGAHQLLGEREPDPQRDQPLLRAVVQVALDPRALEVRRRGDPLARALELRQRASASREREPLWERPRRRATPPRTAAPRRRAGPRRGPAPRPGSPSSPITVVRPAVGGEGRRVPAVAVAPPAGASPATSRSTAGSSSAEPSAPRRPPVALMAQLGAQAPQHRGDQQPAVQQPDQERGGDGGNAQAPDRPERGGESGRAADAAATGTP